MLCKSAEGWQVYGIVNKDWTCSHIKSPGVLTDVSSFRDWIESQVPSCKFQ